MPSQERTPKERETLIFSNSEQAGKFTERIQEQWEQAEKRSAGHKKKVIQDEVAKEFEKYGQAVQSIKHPWDHSPAEHEETQQLVDLAFAKDLGAALRVAQKSEHYPRNLDLFHDILTGEMYDLLKETKLNRQPIGVWFFFVAAIWVIVMSLIIVTLSIS